MLSPRYHLRIQTTGIALLDCLCLIAGSVVGVFVRVGPDEMPVYVYNHLDGWLILAGSIMLANYLAGSYRIHYMFSRFNVVVTWLFSLLFSLMVLSITSFAFFQLLLGRGVLFLSIGVYSLLSLLTKMFAYEHLFRSEIFVCRAVIIGCGERADWVRRTIEGRWVLPQHRVVAWVCVTDGSGCCQKWGDAHDGIAVVRTTVDGLEEVVRNLGVALAVLADGRPEVEKRLYVSLRRLRFGGIEVLSPLNVAEIYSGRTPLELMDEGNLFQASMESRLPVVFRLKRVFDLLVAIAAGLVLLPAAVLIWLVIKLSAPFQPAFYVQTRTGQFGKKFRIVKFRTMRPDAEQVTGPVWSDSTDPRVTRVGRFLRRFRLDELPQFLNVIRGEMSMVGPRPERPELAAELEKKVPFFSERSNLVPGITGWAQIQYPYGGSTEDAARKLEYDIYYMKYLSLSLDLQIVLRTLRIVLFGVERPRIE